LVVFAIRYASGRCEERMGHALHSPDCPVPLGEIRVTTKSGRRMREGGSEDGAYFWETRVPAPVTDPSKHLVDYTAEGARLSFEESMGRLGNGSADGSAFEGAYALRVHDPNDTGYDVRGPYSPDDIDACLAPGGHLEGMVALRTVGLVKEVSLGMNSVGFNEVGEDRATNVLRLIKGAPIGTFDSALLAYGYNLFNQDGVEILQECEARGIAVHVAGAFMMGVFNTSADTKAPPPGGSNKSESTADEKQQWAALAERHGVPLPSVALAFAFAPACVTKIVLGMADPGQVADNMKYVDGTRTIPTALWEEARTLGLVAPGIPTPA
jgi:D-threo-aldose 1-dehydrogenase